MAHVLLKNFSANAFGQAVNIVNTVVLVPFYLTSWSPSLYGAWLVLLALPAYFTATADAGFIPVSGNDMTMKFAQGRRDEVLSIYQSSWLFTTGLSVVIVAAGAIAILAFGLGSLIDLSVMSAWESTQVLLCFLVICLLNFQQGVIQAGLRAIGRFAEGAITYNLVALLEIFITGGALLAGVRPGTMALLLLATRFTSVAINALMQRRYAPWLRYGITQARWAEVRRLLVPSLAILGIPAGNAALLQGLPLILNHVTGPASVAVFVTTRTMTRVVIQVVALVSWASWPEISRHYGAERKDNLAGFLTHGTQLAALLASGFAVVAVVGAPTILHIWTAGRIEADRTLVAILTLASVAAAFRAFPATIIVATNRHISFSIFYLGICLIATIISYPVLRAVGVVGVAIAVAGAELGTLCLSFKFALAVVGRGLSPLHDIFTTRPPVRRLLRR